MFPPRIPPKISLSFPVEITFAIFTEILGISLGVSADIPIRISLGIIDWNFHAFSAGIFPLNLHMGVI